MKKISNFSGSLIAALFLISSASVFADNYVAVGKDGKVFDDASPKYVTLNANNDEVNVTPGMVFKTKEHTPGWYLIEYSPGLHGYLPEQVVAGSINSPVPGNYEVKNNPGQTLNVKNADDNWSATVSGQDLKGKREGNIVVFLNESGNPAFSLVDLGQGGIVINYDNSVTKFF